MILTIDLNPIMDRLFLVDELYNNKLNVAKSSTYGPGGQGIMATSLLHAFNEDVFMTGLLGGLNGEYFHKSLLELSLPHEFLPIREETRSRIKLIDKQGNRTIILDESPRVAREEIGKFYGLYKKLMERSNIICCMGGEFSDLPDDIYFNLVELAREKRKKIILDIKGQGLNLAIEALPYMVILTQNQLENIMGLNLNFENEIVKAGRFILDKGIKYVTIDLQSRGSIVLGPDKGFILDISNYSEEIETIENTSMAAGFAMGFNRNYDMDMILRLGQAFGIASSKEDINKIELSDIKRIMGQIEVYPINY